MSSRTEDSTTSDLVRLARQGYEAMSRGDLDEVVSVFAADAVLDMSAAGLETFQGNEAIRGFVEAWRRSYEDYRYERRRCSIWGMASCLASFGSKAAWSAATVASRSGWRTSPYGRTARWSGTSTTPTETELFLSESPGRASVARGAPFAWDA
jgi:hypothetical protein